MKIVYNGKLIEKLEVNEYCPIPEPCPVCKDIKEDDESDKILSKKLSSPDIIFEQISTSNTYLLIKEYFDKLLQYDDNSLSRFVYVSNLQDFQMLKSVINYLNLQILKVNDNYSVYKNISDEDRVILFNELCKVLNIQNNNMEVKDVLNYLTIEYKFSPMLNFGVRLNLEGFSDLRNFNFYDIYENFIVENFIENNSIFNKIGYFKIHIYDLDTQEGVIRKLIFDITQENRYVTDNSLNYNIQTVSKNNNNLMPNYYDLNSMNEFVKKTLRLTFSKDNPEDYIFYKNEDSRNILEIIKSNIFNIKYENTKTSILYDYVFKNKYLKITELNSSINPYKNGEVIDILESSQYSFQDFEFFIYDVKLNSTKKIYRIINL